MSPISQLKRPVFVFAFVFYWSGHVSSWIRTTATRSLIVKTLSPQSVIKKILSWLILVFWSCSQLESWFMGLQLHKCETVYLLYNLLSLCDFFSWVFWQKSQNGVGALSTQCALYCTSCDVGIGLQSVGWVGEENTSVTSFGSIRHHSVTRLTFCHSALKKSKKCMKKTNMDFSKIALIKFICLDIELTGP